MSEVIDSRTIAYFSMEIALESGMPTYSGGLGVLAGDTLRSAANLNLPMVGITLLYRKGYFLQRLDEDGRQHEEPVEWVIEQFLEPVDTSVSVVIEGRTVQVRPWRYTITGFSGHQVPVYLLDTDLPENSEADRALTNYLYGGDDHYRLCQEIVLGMGGVRMLRALGYNTIDRFHMNEGHAGLLTLELLREEACRAGRPEVVADDLEAVRQKCIFTTHTPVPAGHDIFPIDLAERVLGSLRELLGADQELINQILGDPTTVSLTMLALNLSRYVNGVAKKHAEVSRQMFTGYSIDAITNGVHVATWTSPPFQELFDRYVPGWRQDSFSLRYALSIPSHEVWEAHMQAKRALLEHVNHKTGAGLDPEHLTLGFARRAAVYKRADMLVSDTDRLRRIAENAGPFQVIFAGKAHPRDDWGKALIQRVVEAGAALQDEVRIVYLENYDIELAGLIVPGVDVWLNNPLPPNEASGTSGMKAALNGVPSLSVLDGWWIEGNIEGITGWSISGDGHDNDAEALYEKLEQIVLPLYYRNRDGFINIMQHAIALNGSFFNTQRMLLQYVVKAYLR